MMAANVRPRHSALIVSLLVALAAVVSPWEVRALASQPIIGLQPPQLDLDPGGDVGPEVPEHPPCESTVGPHGTLGLGQTPIPGTTVTIVADHVKLFDTDPYCDTYYQPLQSGQWTWSLSDRPEGSFATLSGADTLRPTVFLDLPGSYEVVLAVCPDGCLFDGRLGVPASNLSLRFDTREFLRPERHPVSPPSVRGTASCDLATGTCLESALTCASNAECDPNQQPLFADDLVEIKCSFGGGVNDPQWVTVQQFLGPESYAGSHGEDIHAVEGVVERARISAMDNEWNHHTQDANWNVQLDGIHRHLKLGGGLSMHNEWETGALPGAFQPSHGDRVSMWGYLIHDCGHEGFKTEIHPPVGIAVHRERAVRIPDDWVSPLLPNPQGNPSTVGLGVYVPGIVTDVWFNREAGEMLSGDRTALHQPAVFVPVSVCPQGRHCFIFRDEFGYLVEGNGILSPSPLGGVFVFRVHLPRSPKAVLEAAGVTGLPKVPLYWEVFSGSIGADRVEVEDVTEATGTPEPDVTYLRVRVDLPGDLPTSTPWFRMAAAWVYPDPDNWGLRRRRVVVPGLNVTNEADGFTRDLDGDGAHWRLWLQLNNASLEAPLVGGLPRQEWTQIINGEVDDGCDFYFGLGCGKDYTFSDRPWSTGNPDAERSLGPDPVVYPDQWLQIHASGFEKDWLGGDSLGVIEQWESGPIQTSVENVCENPDIDWIAGDDLEGHLPQNAGCGRYSLYYAVQDLGAVPPALLSSGAFRLRDAYRLRKQRCSDDACLEVPVLVDGSLPDTEPPATLHPLQVPVTPGAAAVSVLETPLYERQETEENVLNSMTIAQLQAKIAEDLARDPQIVEDFLSKGRETFDAAWRELGDEVLLDLQLLKLAVPEALFEKYFGGLPTPRPLAGTTQRQIKGAGRIGSGVESTHLNLELHCDPLRTPNHLDVSWKSQAPGASRFELDVMLEVACDREPEPMRTHAGRGIGRLDGRPGFLIEWTLVDEGNPGPDGVAVRILSPTGVVVRDARGHLNGQLHARERLPVANAAP